MKCWTCAARIRIPAFLLLADDSKARNFLSGKTLLCKGTCRLEQSRILFEDVKGIPFAALKVSVPLLLGKLLYIPSGREEDRGGGGIDDGGAEKQSSVKAAPPPAKTAAGAPYHGIVKYRQALLGFAQAKSEVKAEIGALKGAILKARPERADLANELEAELEELNDELAEAVNEAMKASENEASPATDAVKLKIRKYLAELASDPLLRELEAKPLLGVKVTIGKTLGEALARIKGAMPA